MKFIIKIKHLLFAISVISTLGYFSYKTTSAFFSDIASSMGNVLSAAMSFPTPTPSQNLSELFLRPQNLTPDAQGKYSFPVDTDIKIDVILKTADLESESVEVVMHYDPALLEAKSIDFSTNTIPNLNLILLQEIASASGHLHLARSIINFPYNPPYPPIPPNTTGIFATLNFRTRILTSSSALTFDFTPGVSNGSILARYQIPQNILDKITNLDFSIESLDI